MKLLIAALLCLPCIAGAAGAAPDQDARWRMRAEHVHIIRDNWGIAHIYGKSDADAVFGMIYAQAEDDFNRVERNYLNGLGWLAQAEGESAVYSDLRERLFIDAAQLQRQYRTAPAWLKTLMIAWSDGLNYYPLQASEHHTEGHSSLRTVDGPVLHRGQHRRRHRIGRSGQFARNSTDAATPHTARFPVNL